MTAIQQALSELQEPDSFWPTPLINSLVESKGISTPVSWVANSLLQALQESDDPFFEIIREQVHHVVSCDAVETIDGLIETWSESHPSDDFVRCHIHFLLAKKSLLDGDIPKLRTGVV